MPSIMRVVQQQQGETQSSLSGEPTTSPASDLETQREQKALGPSMNHQSSSSHSSEHAREHELQDLPTSAPSQPDQPALSLQHSDQSRGRGYRQRYRRRLGDYLRLTWVDWLFIILVYVLCGILYFWSPMYRMNYRKIPLWYDPVKKTWYGPLSLSCQKKGWPDVISSRMTAVVVLVVPLATFLCIQLFTKSFWDAHSAKTGLIQALALM